MAWLEVGPANLEASDPLTMPEIDLVYAAVDEFSISWERHTHLSCCKLENDPLTK